jgi:hypothetical protein
MATKLLIGLIAVVLMASLIRRIAEFMATKRVAVRANRPTSLRRDPRSGVYFPEN